MSRFHALAALALAGILATATAHAQYVRATYSGSVALAAPGQTVLGAGTAIDISVVYDPSKAVDYSAAFQGTGLDSVQAVSLSDDPNASLSITVGGISYTKYDGLQYGTPFGDCDPADCGPEGLGAGNLPAVLFLDGKFSGVGNILINAQGFSIDADPIADYFAGGFGLDGPGTDQYDFYVGEGDLDNPFTTALGVGNFDLGTLQITPVPEPASWTMCIAAFGAMAAVAGSKRRKPPMAGPTPA